MKKSALIFLILTALFEVALCGLYGNDIYFTKPKTWSEARKYCREHHTDLSSITTKDENQKLLDKRNTNSKALPAWIGLYSDANDTWKWSGGKKALFNRSRLMNPNEEDTCVVQNEEGWWKKDCEDEFNFYCFQSKLVLVKENKTWEEAMEQCRQQHTDLVSLRSESALIKTLQTCREAQTDHVWIGLRYLAGNWLWVNGDDMRYYARSQEKAPQCPAKSRHCGALSLEGQLWDSRDCEEKLNFVCY
ncbi:secretory phospholipase A2 receptor-like isoform X1 [Dicentrarchus labrax]|uniref:secretory phospholipase A2 receptor-like isoform X1 n=1 Tax=Dicentrarchus labrax TaxID=13489 RepID=UPI0021F543AC|nr:secretory phospholipase A2 receptor-like isoform X1 [Dicentrarchus labrax]